MEPQIFMSYPKLCHLSLGLEPFGTTTALIVGFFFEKWSPSSHNLLRCITVIGLLVVGSELVPSGVEAQAFSCMRGILLFPAFRLL